jgi:hypothetical protein
MARLFSKKPFTLDIDLLANWRPYSDATPKPERARLASLRRSHARVSPVRSHGSVEDIGGNRLGTHLRVPGYGANAERAPCIAKGLWLRKIPG